jgi:hypothetical protein
MAPIRRDWLPGCVPGKKALNKFMLTCPGGPEDKQIEPISPDTGAKFQRSQNPVLTVGLIQVLQVIGGQEIQFFLWTSIVDLVSG